MNILILLLSAAATATLAQVQPVPATPTPVRPPPASPQPGRPVPIRALAPGEPAGGHPRPFTNYRLRLEIQEGKEAPIEISIVTAEGRVRTQMVHPKRTVIDEREVPSTLDLTATLNVWEPDKVQLTLFLGRTIPYVTGKSSGSDGKGVSQYQQMQISLDTTVVLHVGKPLVLQSDPTQQIKATLEKLGD